MTGILGKKLGMTRILQNDGTVVVAAVSAPDAANAAPDNPAAVRRFATGARYRVAGGAPAAAGAATFQHDLG